MNRTRDGSWTVKLPSKTSSDVAKRPRDASCLSVVSFNSTLRQAQSFIIYLRQRMLLPAFVCLSVCLSVSKITQKCVLGFGWNVACRQTSGHGRTDQLLSPIRIIVWMPEPDCFLRYRMRCNAEFYYVGKIPRTGIGTINQSINQIVHLYGAY